MAGFTPTHFYDFCQKKNYKYPNYTIYQYFPNAGANDLKELVQMEVKTNDKEAGTCVEARVETRSQPIPWIPPIINSTCPPWIYINWSIQPPRIIEGNTWKHVKQFISRVVVGQQDQNGNYYRMIVGDVAYHWYGENQSLKRIYAFRNGLQPYQCGDFNYGPRPGTQGPDVWTLRLGLPGDPQSQFNVEATNRLLEAAIILEHRYHPISNVDL